MNLLYNISIYFSSFVLKIIALFNKKIALFIDGRKDVFQKLKSGLSPNKKTIWFHCASLGEFEQGRPILEKIRSIYTDCQIVLTFFSPSGYEVRKNYAFADVVTYLPIDTRENAKKFLEIIQPEMAIFIKYEFWPNILTELKNRDIDTILVSANFRPDQTFFKWYGNWMRKSLKAFHHFFVQNENSKNLLGKIGFNNVTVSGDTRFDRVFEISEGDNFLPEIANFTKNKYTLVAGSTWQKDEELLVNYINFHASESEKFIIAPHNIIKKDIDKLKEAIQKKVLLYSNRNDLNNDQVLIIDSVGILSKIYSYANVSYVGGGFGNDGVHNVLEPAAFGIPLITGPEFAKFEEAIALAKIGASEIVNNKEELNRYLSLMYHDKSKRIERGKMAKDYIINNIGATKLVVNYIVNKIKALK